MVVNSGTVLAAEKAMLSTPVHMRPSEKMSTGEPRRSDKTPLRNLEFLTGNGRKRLVFELFRAVRV